MKQPQKIEASRTFGPLSLMRMAWKQRLLIVVVTILLTCLGVGVIRLLPNVYRAQALVLVDSQKIPEKFVTSTVQVSLQDSLSAIGQQVLSGDHLQQIISDFKLYPQLKKTKSREEVIARMKSDLTVTLERGLTGVRSGAFSINYEGPNPRLVADVVNRVAQLFIDENQKNREQRAQGTSQFIDEQLREAKKRLESLEASLSLYKQQHTGELPEQQGALLGTLSRLQSELEGNQDALNRAEQNKLLLENTLRFAEAAVASTNAMLSRPPSPPLAATPEAAPQPRSSDALRAELESLRLRYYDGHPAVKRLRAELAQVEEAERQEAVRKPAPEKTENGAGEAVAQPSKAPAFASEQALAEYNRERERAAATKTQLELNRKDIEARNADRGRILSEINDYQVRLERLPVREQQMADLTRDYETSKVNYQTLLDKKMSAGMAMDMERSQQSEQFTVADSARVPTKPVKPRRLLYSAACGLGSLLFAVSAGLLLEIKKNQFLGEWELPPNIRVLGRISAISTRGVTAA